MARRSPRFFFEARVRDPFGETRPNLRTGVVEAPDSRSALDYASVEVERAGDSVRSLGVDQIPDAAHHFEVTERTFRALVEDFAETPRRVAQALAKG